MNIIHLARRLMVNAVTLLPITYWNEKVGDLRKWMNEVLIFF
jgi:hypothetical protein